MSSGRHFYFIISISGCLIASNKHELVVMVTIVVVRWRDSRIQMFVLNGHFF